MDTILGPAVEQASVLQVVVLLAQIQLHMLSQQTAATHELLSACTRLFKQHAQQAQQAQQGQPQSQLLWSQLQLHFCILRVAVMLTEGRYVELIASGTCHTSALCPAVCLAPCDQSAMSSSSCSVRVWDATLTSGSQRRSQA